jgi:hypothetical protein
MSSRGTAPARTGQPEIGPVAVMLVLLMALGSVVMWLGAHLVGVGRQLPISRGRPALALG